MRTREWCRRTVTVRTWQSGRGAERFAAGFRSSACALAGRVSPARAEGCKAPSREPCCWPQATYVFVPCEQLGSATPWLAQGALSLRLSELRRASWRCPLTGGGRPGSPALPRCPWDPIVQPVSAASAGAGASGDQAHVGALTGEQPASLGQPSTAGAAGMRAQGPTQLGPRPRHSQGLDVALGELGSLPGKASASLGTQDFLSYGHFFFFPP